MYGIKKIALKFITVEAKNFKSFLIALNFKAFLNEKNETGI
jgi:hypothetical protein